MPNAEYGTNKKVVKKNVKYIGRDFSSITNEWYRVALKVFGISLKTPFSSEIKSILEKANHKVAQVGTLGLIAKGFESRSTLTTPDAITLHKLLLELYEN